MIMGSITRAAIIGLGLAIAIIVIMITVSILSTDGTDISCKETSNTTAEYRACMAFQKCRSEFKDSSELQGSCIADVILGRDPISD